MLRPVKSSSFSSSVNAYKVKKNELAFWWLGQHGFILKFHDALLYLDPFLSDMKTRLKRPLLKPGEIGDVNLVLGSHDHIDHIDRNAWKVIAAVSPSAEFVVPRFLLPGLSGELKIPENRFIGMDDGISVKAGSVRITGIAAAHEFLDKDEKTGFYPYLGYIIRCGKFTVYHSGDCCVYEGLLSKLKRFKFDAVFLPVNGRDARRLSADCIGNMTYQEAADLAGALEPRLTVPAHYGMFKMNTVDPQLFADYMRVKYPHLKVCVMKYGNIHPVVLRTEGRSLKMSDNSLVNDSETRYNYIIQRYLNE